MWLQKRRRPGGGDLLEVRRVRGAGAAGFVVKLGQCFGKVKHWFLFRIILNNPKYKQPKSCIEAAFL
ncbi:hypothetical protein DDR33_18285 [Pararcticibacter amylolyticus]|uniref:Uncharacterized protein n=1 Tax=Pararcticibacter amylolyticus TaxID=2173175 RepID=A0A2U2PCW6_9SPHI|nr:hypothetical protein DDR33_18285 [Pararcticibacter amylolyticus]